MHITAERLESAGATQEQVYSFLKTFPNGTDFPGVRWPGSWGVEWLAVLIDYPRRADVYKAIDETCETFDLLTQQQRKTWEQQQRHFQGLAPKDEKRFVKTAWKPYKAAKEAAELEYEVFTERAFNSMHAKQFKIIADALKRA